MTRLHGHPTASWPSGVARACGVCGRELRGPSSPDSTDWIGIEIQIGADDQHVLHDRLCDQQSVEWILMVKRQIGQFVEMVVRDR